jgi:malate synthase
LKQVTEELSSKAPVGNKYQLAAAYFSPQITGEEYTEFLTTLLYNEITTVEATSAKL